MVIVMWAEIPKYIQNVYMYIYIYKAYHYYKPDLLWRDLESA